LLKGRGGMGTALRGRGKGQAKVLSRKDDARRVFSARKKWITGMLEKAKNNDSSTINGERNLR